MTTTTNKGYELQVTGSNSGTWGDTLNTDVFERIDSNLGGLVTKSMASADVTLTAAEARNVIVRCTGILPTNRVLTSAAVGFYFLENACTGAYTLTVTNGVSGVSVPQGRRVPLIADGTNGVRIAATEEFTGGTTMLFVQTSAPTGWTKSTSHNDKALRVVSGTASTGGSTAFTTVFAARTIDRANLPNVTLGTTTNGAHTHTVTSVSDTTVTTSGAGAHAYQTTRTTSSNGDHTHTTDSINGNVTQTAFDFAVQYVDVIIASRDSY